jgi:hypothetical protein
MSPTRRMVFPSFIVRRTTDGNQKPMMLWIVHPIYGSALDLRAYNPRVNLRKYLNLGPHNFGHVVARYFQITNL